MDHNNLKFFLNQKDLNDRQQKWVIYKPMIDIEYVKGKNNVVANALSRKAYFCSMIDISFNWKASIITEYAKNTTVNDILDGELQEF